MKLNILFFILLCGTAAFAIDYRVQTLKEAQGLFRAATNTSMYAEAAQQYEFLVVEEGVRNGDLFYTLGNSWFLAGDMGQAILNYRRAERYLPHNADIQHNLETALEHRVDLIPEKEPPPIAAKLLGWHINTSPIFRWWLFAACWLMAWGAWVWLGGTQKKEVRVAMISAGILSVALMTSLLTEALLEQRNEPGVITAPEVLARKGDGEMYAPAFLTPLHSGTEFLRMDDRGTWWQIRLADGQACWIPSRAAETVSL